MYYSHSLPLVLLIIGSTAFSITPIALNPTIIAIMDGRSFGVDGKKVGAMYNMIRHIQDILYGKRNAHGERIGLYIFDGNHHSMQSLLATEEEIMQERQQLGVAATDKARRQQLEKRLAEVHEVFATMKSDFKKIVDPFMADARSAKEPLIKLIEEECKLRNKPNSMLLDWANLVDDELEDFDRKFTSINIFYKFCDDLLIFMGDLIHNCKKGREQFEKLLKEYNQKLSNNPK